jgi:hypothetical protein
VCSRQSHQCAAASIVCLHAGMHGSRKGKYGDKDDVRGALLDWHEPAAPRAGFGSGVEEPWYARPGAGVCCRPRWAAVWCVCFPGVGEVAKCRLRILARQSCFDRSSPRTRSWNSCTSWMVAGGAYRARGQDQESNPKRIEPNGTYPCRVLYIRHAALAETCCRALSLHSVATLPHRGRVPPSRATSRGGFFFLLLRHGPLVNSL